MDGKEMTAEEMEEFINEMPDIIEEDLMDKTKDICNIYKKHAKRLAPVRTGKLRDSTNGFFLSTYIA